MIIGAGLAGLTCAQLLAATAVSVTVVDKGRGPGGRLATRRLDDESFDSGTQFFSVRDSDFAAAVQVWEAAGVVKAWCDGFPLLGAPASVGDGHPRYLALGGMNRLAKHVAGGREVRDQLTVTKLVPIAGRWQVRAEAGDGAKMATAVVGPVHIFTVDAVVVTAPGPQAAHLLQSSGLAVDPRLRAVRYAACCCLLLNFPQAEGPLLPAPGGLRVEDDPVVSWIASQRSKGLRTSGDGLVVHTTPAWSAEHYAKTDDDILAKLRPAVAAVLARAGITATPSNVQLKKWRYSLPTVMIEEPFLRVDGSAPLLIAGDSCGGRPRLEGAWMSGRAAALALLEELL